LLKFHNVGQSEKVSWSVPIDFNGKAFIIEHRKFGVGVFVEDPKVYEEDAKQIVTLIKKGIRIAEPYFEWLAAQAIEKSALNVTNKSRTLFDKFEYFTKIYKEKADETLKRKDERHIEKLNEDGTSLSIHIPVFELRRTAKWIALSAIDSFFSWTEHIFIHLAILQGQITTGIEVADMAEAEWQVKFKQALDIKDTKTKTFFDQLLLIRRQLRNYMAHGAFGKNGAAFHFHSGAGAVPVLLPHQAGKNRFTITGDLDFDEAAAIGIIESFIEHLWSGHREPARLYIQESGLPIILTMARTGAYKQAMASVEDMTNFIEHLSWESDRAANMDW
jgi:hypothetical protein